MIILGTLAVGALGAITARTAVHFANAVFNAVEDCTRISKHSMCGHSFVAKNNAQFTVLEDAFSTICSMAEGVVESANLEREDTGPMKTFILEGVLLWGASGADIRSVVLPKVPEDLAQDISDALIHRFESLSPEEKKNLNDLHLLVE